MTDEFNDHSHLPGPQVSTEHSRRRFRRTARRTLEDQLPTPSFFLNERTSSEKSIAKSKAEGSRERYRRIRRFGRALGQGIPTIGNLRSAVSGLIMAGLRSFANRNPVYRFFLLKIPFKNRTQTIVAADCGCLAGCGCGQSFCSFLGCLIPLLILFIVIGISGVFISRQPGFVEPLFCRQTNAAFCDQDSGVGLAINLSDVPAGAIESYQAVERETGVPWFYLLAWEKVATDFGRADYSDQVGGQVPGQALSATYEAMQASIEGIADSDGKPDDSTMSRLEDQIVADKQSEVKRLTSTLRGGSFGLMLVTNAEYEAYGKRPDGSWRDPWNRTDAATIIALHLLDLFPRVAESGTLRYAGSPDIDRLDPTMAQYIRDQLGEAINANGGAGDSQKLLFYQVISGTWTPAGKHGPAPSFDRWLDGPRVGQPILNPERFYTCQLLVSDNELQAGKCDQFLSGTDQLRVNPDAGLKAAIEPYYQSYEGSTPGTEVSDWPKLQIVMGALMSDQDAWGSEQTGFYIAPETTPEGRIGKRVRINAWAQAINQYAKSAYEAWAAAQAAARAASGAKFAERLGYNFWYPYVTQVAQEYNFPAEYLMATIKADGAFGCQPGAGTGVVPDAIMDWLHPNAVLVGKAMADQLGFVGLTWVPLAAQVMWENSGNIRGNNPGNLTDDGGHAAGVPSYPGQIGWYEGGNDVERHWFAAFATLEDGARANAATYARGTAAYGYDKVLEMGRAGDVLGLARAIEASAWDSGHYGGNHPLPNSDRLFNPDEPEHDGKLVRSVSSIVSAAIGGCWRFGDGQAVSYTPSSSTEIGDGLVVAMNFCLPDRMPCGEALISTPGSDRKVRARIVEYWDGNLGTDKETIAGLAPAVIEALGLSGNGPFRVHIQLVPPPDVARPVELTAEGPLEGVRALADELLASAQLTKGTTPNFEQLAGPWRVHSACVVDRTVAAVPVTDPFNPTRSYLISPWCDYLAKINTFVQIYTAQAGGEVRTIFGVQPRSNYGYIWPIVDAIMTTGFEPRSFGANLTIFWKGDRVKVHDGIDLSPPGCSGQVVVDKDGWLYQVKLKTLAVSGGQVYNYDTWVDYIEHDDGLVSTYAHVNQRLEPIIQQQLDNSPYIRNGHRAVRVEQGQILTSLDAIGCHLHYGIEIPSVSLPVRYPFGGEEARYIDNWQHHLLIDPLSILPHDPTMLRRGQNGQILTSFYLKNYDTPDNFPPNADLGRLGLLNQGVR